jgi:hypothetical protein
MGNTVCYGPRTVRDFGFFPTFSHYLLKFIPVSVKPTPGRLHQAYTDEEGRELNTLRDDTDVDDPVVKNRAGEAVPLSDGRMPKGAHVYLNVYDLFMTNLTTEKYGIGVYHSGVEVMRDEYSFVGGPDDMCSVIKTYPGDTSWMQNGRFKVRLVCMRARW